MLKLKFATKTNSLAVYYLILLVFVVIVCLWPLSKHPVWDGRLRGKGWQGGDLLRGQLDHGADVGVPTWVAGTDDVAIDVSLGRDSTNVVDGNSSGRNHHDIAFYICNFLRKASRNKDVIHVRLCGSAEHVIHV